MKKLFIVLISLFILTLGALFALPYLFKDRILNAVKKDLNRNLNAKVDFLDADISIFKHFPDLYFTLEKFSITETGENKDIPLALIDEFGLTIDVVKLLQGEKKIKSVHLQNPEFVISVDENGNANYDIFKSEEETATEDEESDLQLEIQTITVKNLRMRYEDRSMPMQLYIGGLNHKGNVKIDGDTYLLTGTSDADTLHFAFDGVTYLKNVKARIENEIALKDAFSRYEINKIKALINDLPLGLKGFVQLNKENIEMDIHFASEKNSLAGFMSLIPQAYMPELPQMDINGTAQLTGQIKGVQDDNNYPGYNIDFRIENGRIKGKDLPESIDRINLLASVKFDGGSNLDLMRIEIPRIAFSVADNPAEAYLYINHPVTDPLVKTGLKAERLALNKFKEALPMQSVKKLEGLLDADFDIKTRLSAMEKQQLDRVDARGYLHLKNFAFQTDSIPYPVSIPVAETRITPAALEIDKAVIKAGKSDFDIKGKITNYLTYAMGKDSVLTARIQSDSDLIDFNELSSAMNDEAETTSQEETQAPEIPDNLDIEIQARAGKLIYKDLNLTDISSQINVKDRKAALNTLVMKAFGGEMRLHGMYDTSGDQPFTNLKMVLDNMALDQTAQSLTYLQAYAPVLKQIKGLLNMDLGLEVALNQSLDPVLSTTNATGVFSSENIRPEKVEFFQKLSNTLKINELKNPKIDKAKAQFKIENGNLAIKPFDFKINRIASQLGGKVTLDKKLNLTWDMEIPVEMFGNRAQQWLQNFQGQIGKWGIPLNEIKTVFITLQITGTIENPVIKPVFKKGTGKEGLVQTVKETVTRAVDEKIEETKAQAEAKANELIKQAEAQGDALIEQARQAAERLKAEARKQGDKLIAEAKNPVAKFAAKKTAQKLMQQAEKKGNQLIEKARREKQKLIEQARQKAAKISKD